MKGACNIGKPLFSLPGFFGFFLLFGRFPGGRCLPDAAAAAALLHFRHAITSFQVK
jgi:hypothetical protein